MTASLGKHDSEQITGAGSILEFCKIVALDLGFDTDFIYWVTDYNQAGNKHILMLITEKADIIKVLEMSDKEQINYAKSIGAETIRACIRQKLSMEMVMPRKNPIIREKLFSL